MGKNQGNVEWEDVKPWGCHRAGAESLKDCCRLTLVEGLNEPQVEINRCYNIESVILLQMISEMDATIGLHKRSTIRSLYDSV